MKTAVFVFCILVSGLISYKVTYADWVEMKNCDRISGIITGTENDKLIINTPYAGSIALSWKEVKTFQTDSPVVVSLSDETTLKGTVTPAEDGRISLRIGEILETVSFPLEEVRSINFKSAPPVQTKGRINAGVNISEGNTQTKTYHLDTEAVVRTVKSRYTIGGELNYEEDEGEETVDDALAYLKYDYFLNGKWYLFNNLTLEKDEFKDLRLRSFAGAGVGYQFWESELSNLGIELGVSYVNEDFEEANDENYAAGRWAVNYDRYLLEKIIQFFHYHEGLMGFEDTNDIVIRSRTGFRLPLSNNFLAGAQFHYDWDNSPAPGMEREDKKYLLTIGYSW